MIWLDGYEKEYNIKFHCKEYPNVEYIDKMTARFYDNSDKTKVADYMRFVWDMCYDNLNLRVIKYKRALDN